MKGREGEGERGNFVRTTHALQPSAIGIILLTPKKPRPLDVVIA